MKILAKRSLRLPDGFIRRKCRISVPAAGYVWKDKAGDRMIIDVTKKIMLLLDRRRKCQVLLMTVMIVIGGIMESLSISMILPLVTAVLDQEGWNKTWYGGAVSAIFHITDHKTYIEVLLVLLILIFIVKNLYLLFEYYIQFTFTSRNRGRLQAKLMYKYLRLPYAYYLNASTGEIIRNITGDTNQAFALLTNLLLFYTELFVSIMLSFTMFVISPGISAGLVVLLLAELLMIAKILKPIMNRMGDKQRIENALSNQWLLQAVGGIKSIKISHTEKFFYDNFNVHACQYVEAERKNQTISNAPRLLIEAVTVSFVLGVIFIMVMNGVEILSIIPLISAFLVAAIRLLPSTNRISTALGQISFFKGGLDHVLEKMDENDHILSELEWEKDRNSVLCFEHAIKLQNVSFCYPGSDKKILDSVCMMIHKGQSVGIIGSSGAGKTTLVDIMLGLLKPAEGKVMADDTAIEDHMSGWLQNLAYIPQQIFLTDGTIRENIAFGIDGNEIDDRKVWKALKEAQLDQFVKEQPQKLDTRVGEAGIRLSGGQRQRIGIARALYHDPGILFFDEATSALDIDTESAIIEAVDSLKRKKTMIIVTHRLGTLDGCDTVYKIEDGRVIKER